MEKREFNKGPFRRNGQAADRKAISKKKAGTGKETTEKIGRNFNAEEGKLLRREARGGKHDDARPAAESRRSKG